MYKEIIQCRICANHELNPILDLGMQALTGVFPHPGEVVDEGPLQLVKCSEVSGCGLVQLRHSFEPEHMYGENYGYRSGLNRSMVAHLQGIARAAKAVVQLNPNDVVLDIGSNDSTLLQAVYEPGLTAIGMDPSGAKFKEFYPSHIQLIPDFFSASEFFKQTGPKRAKLVFSIAMFYDLEVPQEFMRQVREVLADDGVWIFEQSYLPSMLEMNSYDTICHEHLEYYCLRQIRWMAERAGLRILDAQLSEANGGSFRITAGTTKTTAQTKDANIAAIVQKEEVGGFGTNTVYAAFRDRALRHRDELRALLRRYASEGKVVAGYGASTKGNVLLQFCGFSSKDLPLIAEVNPDKFGRVTPGTHIPIVSEKQALDTSPDAFLVLPWHFRDDFISRADRYLAGGRAFIFPLPEIEIYHLAKSLSHRV